MGCASSICACKSWNTIRDKSNNINEHIRARRPMLPENTQKTIISFPYKKEQIPRTHLHHTPPSNLPRILSIAIRTIPSQTSPNPRPDSQRPPSVRSHTRSSPALVGRPRRRVSVL